MAYSLLQSGTLYKGNRTVVRAGVSAASYFFIRNKQYVQGKVQPWGWAEVIWNTGDVNVGLNVVSQIALVTDRTLVSTPTVPAGTLEIWAFIPKYSPLDSYLYDLYRYT